MLFHLSYSLPKSRGQSSKTYRLVGKLARLELATSTLARWRSSIELQFTRVKSRKQSAFLSIIRHRVEATSVRHRSFSLAGSQYELRRRAGEPGLRPAHEARRRNR